MIQNNFSNKIISQKKFTIDWHWILTVFLVFYCLFSFAWIAVLYSGVDGSRICKDNENFVCRIEFPITKQSGTAIGEKNASNTALSKQKAAKNLIRTLLQSLVTVSDDLASAQVDYEQTASDYKSYVSNYIRFLNEEPQLLPGFRQLEFENKKVAMEEVLSNLRQKRNLYAETKSETKRQVDQIYTDLKERQENSYKQNK